MDKYVITLKKIVIVLKQNKILFFAPFIFTLIILFLGMVFIKNASVLSPFVYSLF